MKWPRLQFNYVAFYVFSSTPDRGIGHGLHFFFRNNRLSKAEHITDLCEKLAEWNSDKGTTKVIVSNYKLLSINIIWR